MRQIVHDVLRVKNVPLNEQSKQVRIKYRHIVFSNKWKSGNSELTVIVTTALWNDARIIKVNSMG